MKLPFQDRTVNLPQLLFRSFVFHANHNAVRVKEILYRRAFTQEFRIRDDAEVIGLVLFENLIAMIGLDNKVIESCDSQRQRQVQANPALYRVIATYGER